LLILDIGTEFIKALILKIGKWPESRKGTIAGVGRCRQIAGQMQAGSIADIDGVAFTSQKAIERAVKKAGFKPKKVLIGISGEFIKGSSANFLSQREKPEKEVELAEVKNIIQKMQWQAFDGTRRQLSEETGRPEMEIKLVNALITEIRIDNHPVSNPLGFRGKDIFLNIFNVYAPLFHLKAVETLAKKLNLELVSVVAEPYALARSVCPGGEAVPLAGAFYESAVARASAENAIFIDVGGGTTDVALVRQGGVEGIKSLALAGRAFTRRLSQSLNLGWLEAEEVKMRYGYRQLSRGVQSKIGKIFEKDTEVWLKGVELILEDFNRKEFYPPLILLCGGGSLLPEIKKALEGGIIKKQWLERFPFSQPPRVDFIKPEHISNIIDPAEDLDGPEYITPMALASLSLELIRNEKGVLPPTIRRIVRMMMR